MGRVAVGGALVLGTLGHNNNRQRRILCAKSYPSDSIAVDVVVGVVTDVRLRLRRRRAGDNIMEK